MDSKGKVKIGSSSIPISKNWYSQIEEHSQLRVMPVSKEIHRKFRYEINNLRENFGKLFEYTLHFGVKVEIRWWKRVDI